MVKEVRVSDALGRCANFSFFRSTIIIICVYPKKITIISIDHNYINLYNQHDEDPEDPQLVLEPEAPAGEITDPPA